MSTHDTHDTNHTNRMSSPVLRAAATARATADGIVPATFTACADALSQSATWGNTFAALPLIRQFAVLEDFIGYLREYPALTLAQAAKEYVTGIGHSNLRAYARCCVINLHDATGVDMQREG